MPPPLKRCLFGFTGRGEVRCVHLDRPLHPGSQQEPRERELTDLPTSICPHGTPQFAHKPYHATLVLQNVLYSVGAARVRPIPPPHTCHEPKLRFFESPPPRIASPPLHRAQGQARECMRRQSNEPKLVRSILRGGLPAAAAAAAVEGAATQTSGTYPGTRCLGTLCHPCSRTRRGKTTPTA